MAVEYTLETLTKAKVIEQIGFWGWAYAQDHSVSRQEDEEFSQELKAVIAWVNLHTRDSGE